MKIKFPIEAFALAMIVFSGNMKEAFVTGILMIAITTGCELFHELIKDRVPDWSRRASVFCLTGAVSYAAFRLAYYTLGLALTTNVWLMQVAIGLLIAKHVLAADSDVDYDLTIFESAVAYGFFILAGICREFFGQGSIFGYPLTDAGFVAKNLQDVMFGFITAGIGLGFTNSVLRKGRIKAEALWVILPVVLLYQPFKIASVPEAISILAGIAVPVIFFLSARRRLVFAVTSAPYKKLPVELLSMGFIYMILHMF